MTSQIAKPFIIPFKQKRLTLALSPSLTPNVIQEIAGLVTTGLLSGFIVQGEINLGEHTFNNLDGLPTYSGLSNSEGNKQ